MKLSDQELGALNFYRASELYCGLLLGQTVARARDPKLVLDLTRHSAEEMTHARLWTETILAVGGSVQPVRSTYQTRYADVLGRPSTLLHVLAATQVFERRLFRHFLEHLRRPGTHPQVQATLTRIIEDEKHHLFWVKEWFDRQAQRRGDAVEEVLRRYTEVDARIYDSLRLEYGWTDGADESGAPRSPREPGEVRNVDRPASVTGIAVAFRTARRLANLPAKIASPQANA